MSGYHQFNAAQRLYPFGRFELMLKGVTFSGGIFYQIPHITVSPIKIALNRFWNAENFACGAQIWSDLLEIEGWYLSAGGYLCAALNWLEKTKTTFWHNDDVSASPTAVSRARVRFLFAGMFVSLLACLYAWVVFGSLWTSTSTIYGREMVVRRTAYAPGIVHCYLSQHKNRSHVSTAIHETKTRVAHDSQM